MRKDKDRTGKWLLAHHGDAILRLGGVTGFSSWKPLQAETVAPRRTPDGLIEVRFPGDPQPALVLEEIETYPDADNDRQVLDDLMVLALDRGTVPEVVSLVLKPKGNLTTTGQFERVGPRGHTRVSGSWPVVRLWELSADELLAMNDPGVIPWVPLAKSDVAPESLMVTCRERIQAVTDPMDRAGLLVVTQILAGLAFPGRTFLDLFGGPEAMIESPVLDEVKEILRKRYEAEGAAKALRGAILANLEARFGSAPEDRIAPLGTITDETRLKGLHRLAATCPDLDTFVAGLTAHG
jgi:hypothetical protein